MSTQPLPISPPPVEESSGGKLSATILSVYDIPSSKNGNGSTSPIPMYVSMSVLGKEVKTGKPSSKHKLMNNFKFVSTETGGAATNALSLSAPLSVLYPTIVTFRVVFDSSETMIAKCQLSSTLQINQQQWLILNLYPESSYPEGQEPIGSSSDTENQPTLRLKLCLSGPYRTEIGAVVSLANAWFDMMDSVSSATNSTFSSVTNAMPLKFPSPKILLVPTVPLAAASVALLPIVFGILVMGLPFFVPILVILLTAGASTLLVGSGVYFSTSKGREAASIVLGPLYSTFSSTNAGQQLLYQTGPRPSPTVLVRTVMPTDLVGKLVVSLLIDFIGSSSYLLPFVGEGFDVAWAPIQTIFIMALYDESMPSLKYISFLEEIMPFTDLLPSGTLGWVREFSPLLMSEGIKKFEDLQVIMRSEADVLKKDRKSVV